MEDNFLIEAVKLMINERCGCISMQNIEAFINSMKANYINYNLQYNFIKENNDKQKKCASCELIINLEDTDIYKLCNLCKRPICKKNCDEEISFCPCSLINELIKAAENLKKVIDNNNNESNIQINNNSNVSINNNIEKKNIGRPKKFSDEEAKKRKYLNTTKYLKNRYQTDTDFRNKQKAYQREHYKKKKDQQFI